MLPELAGGLFEVTAAASQGVPVRFLGSKDSGVMQGYQQVGMGGGMSAPEEKSMS